MRVGITAGKNESTVTPKTGTGGPTVFYPLTVNDFLNRAVTVYPDRIAVIDEPNQPAESWGEITYAELGRRARAQAASLDEMGVPVGGRVASSSVSPAGDGCWCR